MQNQNMQNNDKIGARRAQHKSQNDQLQLLLARPRGFCAGVDRAVRIVQEALAKYGAPVYVRHEIVHNAHVVKQLAEAGAIFVETLSEIPQDQNIRVIFSAHGVAPAIVAEAQARGFHVLDATCPLVSKVHKEVQRHVRAGRHVFLIGHHGHPEMIGTIGHIGGHIDGDYTLIETIEDVHKLTLPRTAKTAYATQTTLSVSETAEIIQALKARFDDIAQPNGEDICYATTNRQSAVAAIAEQCDLFLILGAENSSNAQRLVETAQKYRAKKAQLIQDAGQISWDEITVHHTIGLSAGASTPEFLVQNVIKEMRARFPVRLVESDAPDENITFKSLAELSR